MSRRRLPVVAALALALSALMPPTGVEAAAPCGRDPAQSLTSSEAAVSRPALRSPSEYALSNVYARGELATRPDFVYAEAGPQYAGAFEALLPVGTPPPPRAVSAFPSEDIPDADRSDWGGHSETKVSSSSAYAASSGVPDLGIPGLTVSGARSFTSTVVECNVITIIAGWSADDVSLANGPSFERLGQVVTLVVGPSGSSAKVEATTVPAGRPFAAFTDPMTQGGGPQIEIGDPTTATAAGVATASGGGFSVLQTDPASGQGAGYRFGSVEASIRVLVPGTPKSSATQRPEPLPPIPKPTHASLSTTGDAPAPAPAAVAPIRPVLIADTVTQFLKVTSPNPTALAMLAAALVATTGLIALVAVGRRRYPTLDWIARHTITRGRRFVVTYLQW